MPACQALACTSDPALGSPVQGPVHAASTASTLDPALVADLLAEDVAKRQHAQDRRQADVLSAWLGQPHPLTTELDCRQGGSPEPESYAAAADALAIGVDSPFAARAIMGQILRVASALRRDKASPDEQQAQIRTIRSLVQELHPKGVIDGMLAAHLIMFDQVRFKVLFYLAGTNSAADVVLFATALEKLTRAQLDTMAAWDRRHRPRRRAGHRIVVRDQAQAVIGDVGPANR